MKDLESAKKYLTREEAAEFIGLHGLPCSPRTLAKLACLGGGPRYRRYGRNAIYTEADLEQWMEQKLDSGQPSNGTRLDKKMAR
jgi:hypothetical protein